MKMEQYLTLAKELALEAGAIMTNYFGLGVVHTLKKDHSPLTEADNRIHQLVVDRVQAVFPEHNLYGEEGIVMKNSEFTWVFDPIDGTAPFLRGIPTNVFSLALVQNGTPIVGVVYDPYMKRLYEATRGGGAFLNDIPMKTSTHTALSRSYVETDGHKGFKNLLFLETARTEGVRLLSYSSTVYAHMLVASGQLDGVVFPLPNAWDCAAAKIIVEEAGGTVSDLEGHEQRYDQPTHGFVSAGTPEFHTQLLALIAPSI